MSEKSEKITLKPCPFCGAEAFMETTYLAGVAHYYVRCTYRYCEARIQFPMPARKEAAAMWNFRVSDRENELKPCPFCGGIAHFEAVLEGSGRLYVKCESCGMRSPAERFAEPEAKNILLAAWNRRDNHGSKTEG